jgi:hypothetical protein
VRLSPLTRDCLRSGLSGAVASAVFGAAMAGALLSTGPKALPAAASQAAPSVAARFATPRRYVCAGRAHTAEVAAPFSVTGS